MLEERDEKDKLFKYCFKQMVEKKEMKEKVFILK